MGNIAGNAGLARIVISSTLTHPPRFSSALTIILPVLRRGYVICSIALQRNGKSDQAKLASPQNTNCSQFSSAQADACPLPWRSTSSEQQSPFVRDADRGRHEIVVSTRTQGRCGHSVTSENAALVVNHVEEDFKAGTGAARTEEPGLA
jgi:hypothetical protein